MLMPSVLIISSKYLTLLIENLNIDLQTLVSKLFQYFQHVFCMFFFICAVYKHIVQVCGAEDIQVLT